MQCHLMKKRNVLMVINFINLKLKYKEIKLYFSYIISKLSNLKLKMTMSVQRQGFSIIKRLDCY